MQKKDEKRGLGRGLSALMMDARLDPSSTPSGRPDQTLAIDLLIPNPLQPRKDFDQAALNDLADSIRQKGIIQPLIVRPVQGERRYEIVAGERRWRAAQLAQVHDVPVIIRDLQDQEVLEIAIIENIQRADLNAIEEALGYRSLMESFGHTQEVVAQALSKSRSHVANLLRLLNLPAEVQSMVRAGTLSAGHARALITSSDPLALALTVVGKGLSVRETEKLAQTMLGTRPSTADSRPRRQEKDADTRAIEADLSASLGMSVDIQHQAGGDGGVISIRYHSLDQLDALCSALSVVQRDILAK
jgi:ParB family transcriptional regulator, chromosome partitioning protein